MGSIWSSVTNSTVRTLNLYNVRCYSDGDARLNAITAMDTLDDGTSVHFATLAQHHKKGRRYLRLPLSETRLIAVTDISRSLCEYRPSHLRLQVLYISNLACKKLSFDLLKINK